eukprot:gene11516-24083_t
MESGRHPISGTVKPALFELLVKLNDVDDRSLGALTDIVVNFLLEKNSDHFQSSLELYLQDFPLEKGFFKILVRALIIFLEEGISDAWDVKKLEEKCNQYNIDQSKTSVLVLCWKNKSAQITSSILSSILSINELIDMDWSFGVTCATEDCHEMSQTFLQLKLVVNGRKDNRGVRTLFMELTIEQFYKFLAQMESARAYISLVSTPEQSDVPLGTI